MLIITVQAQQSDRNASAIFHFLQSTDWKPHFNNTPSHFVGLWLQPRMVFVGVQCAVLPGHRPVSGHLRGCGVDRPQSGQGASPKPAQQDHTGPHEVRCSVCVRGSSASWHMRDSAVCVLGQII